MTSPQTASDYPALQNIDNGCDTLRFLWALANKDFDLTHPGLAGLGSRVTSFIEIERVPVFMQLAAMKCWEERTRGNNTSIPFPPMPTPGFDDLARKRGHSSSSGGSSSSSGASSSGGGGKK